MPIKILAFCLIAFSLLGCKDKGDNSPKNQANSNQTTQPLPVQTRLIKPQSFQKQIIANGLVRAARKTKLRFKSGNRIARIFVENGEAVSKGETLAVLDNAMLKNQLEKAKIQLAKAEQKLTGEKIKYGYGSTKEEDIDPEVLKNLQIKSDYLAAKNTVEKIQVQYDQTSLEAPFSGVIANLETKPGNYITPAEVFCLLIDNNNFEIYFSVLEGELPFIEMGQEVKIVPFSNSGAEHTGNITEINPVVGENGLVKIKAAVNGNAAGLLEGMHVKVFVKKPIDSVVVVPKKAVVLRSNRPVVFTVENGLAKWNYVELLHENSTSYAIKEGVEVGDTVIVSGNMNLSHDARVKATFLPEKTNDNG